MPEPHAVAAALLAGPPAALALAAAEIEAGRGPALFQALLAAARPEGADETAAVTTVMATAERAAANPFVAAYLMASLHPIAARSRAHAVHDAIGLWFADLSDEAARALVVVAGETHSPRLRDRCETWLATTGWSSGR